MCELASQYTSSASSFILVILQGTPYHVNTHLWSLLWTSLVSLSPVICAAMLLSILCRNHNGFGRQHDSYAPCLSVWCHLVVFQGRGAMVLFDLPGNQLADENPGCLCSYPPPWRELGSLLGGHVPLLARGKSVFSRIFINSFILCIGEVMLWWLCVVWRQDQNDCWAQAAIILPRMFTNLYRSLWLFYSALQKF